MDRLLDHACMFLAAHPWFAAICLCMIIVAVGYFEGLPI